ILVGITTPLIAFGVPTKRAPAGGGVSGRGRLLLLQAPTGVQDPREGEHLFHVPGTLGELERSHGPRRLAHQLDDSAAVVLDAFDDPVGQVLATDVLHGVCPLYLVVPVKASKMLIWPLQWPQFFSLAFPDG